MRPISGYSSVDSGGSVAVRPNFERATECRPVDRGRAAAGSCLLACWSVGAPGCVREVRLVQRYGPYARRSSPSTGVGAAGLHPLLQHLRHLVRWGNWRRSSSNTICSTRDTNELAQSINQSIARDRWEHGVARVVARIRRWRRPSRTKRK